MVFKRIKVKLYPTVKQKEVLEKHLNAYRFCYNLCLQYKTWLWNDYKINITAYQLQKELFEIRKETPFLKECKAECIREVALKLDAAFKFFFSGKGYPRYKSKKQYNSFFAHQSLSSKDSKIKFYGNTIKYKTSDFYMKLLDTNEIRTITFKKDKSGDYWATCLIKTEAVKLPSLTNNVLGIDLGLKNLIITSNGVTFPNNKYLINSEFKLKKIKRKFAKSKKGGKNREKLRIKTAKLYRKSFRQREHYYHQVTNELIRENQTIVIETLKIQNMMKNHKVARSISDASWDILINQLEYKAAWYGRKLIKVGAFFPSSKTCSNCGNIKEILLLSERVYKCDCCGFSIDRDINAAINIRNAGLKIPGVPVEGVGYEPIETGSNSLIINH